MNIQHRTSATTQTVTVELYNEHAMSLLKDLERMNVLKWLKKRLPEQVLADCGEAFQKKRLINYTNN